MGPYIIRDWRGCPVIETDKGFADRMRQKVLIPERPQNLNLRREKASIGRCRDETGAVVVIPIPAVARLNGSDGGVRRCAVIGQIGI